MALANYTDLQAAIASWSFNRTDLPTTDLITLGETRLNRDLRLRVMETEDELSSTTDSREMALPSDFLAPIALLRVDSTGRVPMPQLLPITATSETAGQPDFWAIDGANIVFERPADDEYDFVLRYRAKFNLSDASPTNWLLTNHPDAYLSAALVEAALWAQDDDQASRWQARYQAAIDPILKLEARSRQAALKTELAAERGFDINRG